MKKWLFFLLIALSISSCSVLSPNSNVYINGDKVKTDAVSVPLTRKQSEDEKKVKIQKESQTGKISFCLYQLVGFKK